jgi:diguanylate cyclase (GGDEF)-like protein/PAS domain S-box-containing protein
MSNTVQPPRVLVVDDNPENLDLLVGILEPLEYDIGVATSGESALRVIPLLQPDLILLDVMMPGIDGYETCAWLKGNPDYRDIPVIFITAKTDISDLKKGFEVGGVDYIGKPVQREEVLARTQTHIALRQLAKSLEQNYQQLAAILSVVKEGTFCIDQEGRIGFANPAAISQLGFTEKQLVSLGQVVPEMAGDSEIWSRSPIYAVCKDGGEFYSDNYSFYCKSGDSMPVEFTVSALTDKQGEAFGAIVAFRDITEKKQSEQRLVSLMSTDQLTGLENWGEFRKHLGAILEQNKKQGDPVSVLLLDLDDFRDINDTLGHDSGDLVLTMVANRLRSNFPDDVLITRLGGDEFALLVDGSVNKSRPDDLAQQILVLMQKPFDVLGNQLFLTTSVGIVTSEETSSNAADMIRAADVAVHRAKEQDKGGYAFYSADRQREVIERMRMTNSLRKGIQNNELLPYFQPIIDVKSGDIIGAEALIRWHAKDETIIPDNFIGVAESSGLISNVGDLVLEAVCSQLDYWQQLGGPLTVGINVSARQLRNPDFPNHFFSIVDKYGIDPAMLSLELTESTLMEKPERAIRMFKQFQEKKVEIAIDDFGTGFSSLSYLTRLSANILKIDRGFVSKIGEDTATESIVLTILGMAKGLGMKVIAEGVETEQQKQFLVNHGCDMLQGYLFARPQPAEEFTQMLRNNRIRSANS